MENADAMDSLPERIMEYGEATPIQADDLLHLGARAAVARTLSRLARSEQVLRICRGVYTHSTLTHFGLRAPGLEHAVTERANFLGETIVSSGRRRGQLARSVNPERRMYGLSHFRSRPTPAFRGRTR